MQVFPALPDRKKVQATHRSRRLEVVANLQRRHGNVGQVAEYPGRVQQGNCAQSWQESR